MDDSCPITSAIRVIRGGNACDEHDDSRVVTIGGSEYVCDDVSYYMSRRRLEFARYEVAMRTIALDTPSGTSMPTPISYIGKTYREVASAIIDAVAHHRLYDQIAAICDVISRMEDLIQRRVLVSGATDVTLCCLCESFSDIDPRLLFNPVNACEITNALIDHVSGTDINVMLSSPCEIRPQRVPEFTGTPPDWNSIIPDHLHAEMIVAEHLRDVESYHCVCLEKLGIIHAMCDEILSKLL